MSLLSAGVLSSGSSIIHSCDIRNIVGGMIYSYHNRTDYPFEDCHKDDSLILGLVLGGIVLLIIITILIIYFCMCRPMNRAKSNRELNNTLIV